MKHSDLLATSTCFIDILTFEHILSTSLFSSGPKRRRLSDSVDLVHVLSAVP